MCLLFFVYGCSLSTTSMPWYDHDLFSSVYCPSLPSKIEILYYELPPVLSYRIADFKFQI